MFGKNYVADLIDRSAETPADRRRFMKGRARRAWDWWARASWSGWGRPQASAAEDANAISDSTVLNFALNLEYLEAEFNSYAVYVHGLPSSLTYGKGRRGPVEGGREVPFNSRSIRQFATEIARDEHEHVAFLRSATMPSPGPRSTSTPASPMPRSRRG